jgi:hypothetical protein
MMSPNETQARQKEIKYRACARLLLPRDRTGRTVTGAEWRPGRLVGRTSKARRRGTN